jgi:hypothetical protein
MKALQETLEKLRQTGSIGLEDFKNLKMKDLEHLTEEIKQWCLYGNGKAEKLGKKHKEH